MSRIPDVVQVRNAYIRDRVRRSKGEITQTTAHDEFEAWRSSTMNRSWNEGYDEALELRLGG